MTGETRTHIRNPFSRLFSGNTIEYSSILNTLQIRVQVRIFSLGECLVKTSVRTNLTYFILLSSKE